jgi:hypothetical protein
LAKNALTVEFTAVEQHLSKAQIVTDCGKGAGSPAVKLRRRVEEVDGLGLARQRVVGESTGEARALRLREVECGIFHAEWLPYIGSQVVAEALLAYLFDDRAQHVNRKTVLENRPRLMRQRQLRDAIDEGLCITLDGRRRPFRVLTRDRARAVRASSIHETRCVAIKVVYVDR